ncbi:DUF397 domain-containing protein [Streptomyces sp. NPDC058202]|uniref:DUF397 domain-containing protein n=1 Tax=Streptomyces sp. NPDC058202 TaxID=3346380 RepID=UPI0036F0E0F9
MNPAPPTAVRTSLWFRSSYSNGAGGECVECALDADGMLVRDSKWAAGPVVAVRSLPWRAFTEAEAAERSHGPQA